MKTPDRVQAVVDDAMVAMTADEAVRFERTGVRYGPRAGWLVKETSRDELERLADSLLDVWHDLYCYLRSDEHDHKTP